MSCFLSSGSSGDVFSIPLGIAPSQLAAIPISGLCKDCLQHFGAAYLMIVLVLKSRSSRLPADMKLRGVETNFKIKICWDAQAFGMLTADTLTDELLANYVFMQESGDHRDVSWAEFSCGC